MSETYSNSLTAKCAKKAEYEVIGVFGILYHVMDHFRLFQAWRKLNPNLIIVDSEFMLKPGPVIQLVREKTDNILNAAPQFEGQKVGLKGGAKFCCNGTHR